MPAMMTDKLEVSNTINELRRTKTQTTEIQFPLPTMLCGYPAAESSELDTRPRRKWFVDSLRRGRNRFGGRHCLGD